VKQAVALCSTALTPGHLQLLHRLEAKELVLLLDGDEAGRKAVERLAGSILAAGATAKVALLPDGEDPDTYARKVGAEAIQKLIATARPLSEHLLKDFLPEGPGASFEAKMAALDRLRPITTALPVGLTRSAFFGAMARHFGLPAQELEATLRSRAPQPVKAAPKVIPPGANEPPPDTLEATYAATVLRSPLLLARDTLRVHDELKHNGIRSLVAAVQSGQGSADVLYETSEALRGALTRARDLLPAEDGPLEQAFAVVCRRLKVRAIEDRLRSIAAQTAAAPGGSTELTPEARDLLEERGSLLEAKRALLATK
jgi:DNA primase